jgi:2,3-bisphosphoglycerate-independent phosphoglycerate mutase
MDGWGDRTESENNAVKLADTPVWDRLTGTCPRAQLDASEQEVGLPAGQMGNSEVGHMNLGAGRIVMQDLPRIDAAIADGSIASNEALTASIDALKKSGGTAHVIGLMSPGGVHSHQNQIAELCALFDRAGVPVRVHAFTDGRDTPPESALGFLDDFQGRIAALKDCRIATVTGRYFAMDRDKRWDRVRKAWGAMVLGEGAAVDAPAAAVQAAYDNGKSDEFVEASIVGTYAGMQDGDGLVMANFRADRAREILSTLVDPGFDGFERSRLPSFATALGLVEYSTEHNQWLSTMFPPVVLSDILGEVVSKAGRTQLRIAETEKYAHVTFFFNGGEEKVFEGEERILVPSPDVPTYDLQPEMSAPEVTDKVVAAIESGKFDLIILNFANTDMVGHTGILEAAIKAVETVDASLGRIEAAIRKAGGVMLVTADHGNAEMMMNRETGQAHTAHTLNLVPAVLVNAPDWCAGLQSGRLADVAPTLLQLMGLEQPDAMTGRSLLTVAGEQRASA